ncbi:ATP-binding cassette domain-containing protein [Amycolatopsis sp. A133]|uniref:ATP-binding cassette domain-containing protein n=1 Tax=Amycolatopsis sp. A133 TaxID=3064472 RepID=UPI0037BE3BAB
MGRAAPLGRRTARTLVGGRRRAPPGPRAERGAAAVRRDRAGAVVRRPVRHPRRADRAARRRRHHPAVRAHRRAAAPRCHVPVHQPPLAGGVRDLRHGDGVPGRPARPHRAGRRAAEGRPRRSDDGGERNRGRRAPLVGPGRRRPPAPGRRPESRSALRSRVVRRRARKIVGLAGSGSSGKTELAETLAGLRKPTSGTVFVAGRRPRPGDVPSALAAGIGFVPEDRHHQGFVPEMSIADNTTMSVLDRLGPGIFVRSGLRDRLAGKLITRLAVKTPGPELPVSALSGGNQQKVVMARALAGDPRLLVLITPTAGVDVRSKEFLLDKVAEAAAAGTAVLIASDELDDLRLCDRLLVVVHGRLTTEIAAGRPDREVVAAMEGVDLDA